MGGCILLTTRQAATIHTSAVINHEGALKMARYFQTLPAIARSFYEEASDWKNIGRQIEAANPDLTPHNWRY